MSRDPSPATRAICGPFLEAVQAMADELGVSRATVLRSMIAAWFERYPDEAARFGAPTLCPAEVREVEEP